MVLASTREGEEALLLRALRTRISDDLLVLLIPRHPQRFDEVESLISGAGFSVARRSRSDAIGSHEVLLGDTMGEMPAYYAAADVAVIGGTLLPYGGQNLIEASAAGVPVVLGPHVHNFSEAARLAVDCGAAVQVANAADAIDAALDILSDPEKGERMRRAGFAFSAEHRGATLRHIEAIRNATRRRTGPE